MIGLEAEYGYLRSKGSGLPRWADGEPMGDGNGLYRNKIGSPYGYGLIGGRLGYAYERSLFYVKSGAVFTRTQSGYTDACSTAPCASGLLSTSGKSDNVGYAIGGGIEQALPPEWFESAKHISIKAEYLYLGIGRTQTTSGVYSVYTLATNDHIRGMHTAKIGINYQFEGF